MSALKKLVSNIPNALSNVTNPLSNSGSGSGVTNNNNNNNVSGQEALLRWCVNSTMGYEGVKVVDFEESWRDGLALCALINKYHPELLNFKNHLANSTGPKHNYEVALSCLKNLNIPAIIDYEADIQDKPVIDKTLMVPFLSAIYFHFNKSSRASLFSAQNKPNEKNNPPPLVFVPSSTLSPGAANTLNAMGNDDALKRQSIVVGAGDESTRPLCGTCNKPLCGDTVEGAGSVFHAQCFVCFQCKKQLTTRCMNVKNKPYCTACGKQAFASNFKGMPVMGMGGPPPGLMQKRAEEQQRQQEKQEEEEKEKQMPGEIVHRTRDRPMGPRGRRLPQSKATPNKVVVEPIPYPDNAPVSTLPDAPNPIPSPSGAGVTRSRASTIATATPSPPARSSIAMPSSSLPQSSIASQKGKELPSLPPKAKTGSLIKRDSVMAPKPLPKPTQPTQPIQIGQNSQSAQQGQTSNIPSLPPKTPSTPTSPAQQPSQPAPIGQTSTAPKLPPKPQLAQHVTNQSVTSRAPVDQDSDSNEAEVRRPMVRRSTISSALEARKSMFEQPKQDNTPNLVDKPLPAPRTSLMKSSNTPTQSSQPINRSSVAEHKLGPQAPQAKSLPVLPVAGSRKTERPSTIFFNAGASNKSHGDGSAGSKSMFIPGSCDDILELRKQLSIEQANKDAAAKDKEEREKIATWLEKRASMSPAQFEAENKRESERQAKEREQQRKQLEEERKRLSDRKSLAIKKRLTVLDERSSIMSFLNQLASDEPRQSYYNQPNVSYQQPQQNNQYQQQNQQQYEQQYPQQSYQQPFQQQYPQQYEQQYPQQSYQQPFQQQYPQQHPQQYPQQSQQFQQNQYQSNQLPPYAIQDIPEDELVEDVERYNYETKFANRLEGYLLKQSVTGIFNIARNRIGLGNWTRKYFSLLEDKLVFYPEKKNNITGKDHPPDGIILMGSIESIAPVKESSNIFRITTLEESYLLQAANTNEMNEWIRCLQQAKQYFDSLHSQMSNDIFSMEKSGMLEKMGPFRVFYKRYFVLRDGFLYRYRAGGEKDQLGKIPLYGARFHEYMPGSYTACFEIISKTESIVLKAPNAEIMHDWLNAMLKQKLLIEEAVSSIIL